MEKLNTAGRESLRGPQSELTCQERSLFNALRSVFKGECHDFQKLHTQTHWCFYWRDSRRNSLIAACQTLGFEAPSFCSSAWLRHPVIPSCSTEPPALSINVAVSLVRHSCIVTFTVYSYSQDELTPGTVISQFHLPSLTLPATFSSSTWARGSWESSPSTP